MAEILVVDDEKRIRNIVRKYAEFEGHTVTEASDGLEAVSVFAGGHFDAVILDIMLPGLDGYSVLRQIRKNSEVPVIMLSALGEEYDRLKGFELGIDDYVVKPFSARELMYRINGILKRTMRQNPAAQGNINEKSENCCCEMFVREGLQADLMNHTLTVDGEKKELTYKAFELLACLIRNRNIALTREQLITAVWGYDYCGDDRTLDTHIKFLRGALGNYRDRIVTIRNVGYRFDDR